MSDDVICIKCQIQTSNGYNDIKFCSYCGRKMILFSEFKRMWNLGYIRLGRNRNFGFKKTLVTDGISKENES